MIYRVEIDEGAPRPWRDTDHAWASRDQAVAGVLQLQAEGLLPSNAALDAIE